MSRVIFHSDANSFYANVECLYRPEIRDQPVAVCGDPEDRHGIVLTKNQHAKKFGIQTAEAIWQAKKKCPGLIVVPPDMDLYLRFSESLRQIYNDYSDRVEAFGLDECWLDVSDPKLTVADSAKLADEIRERVKRELGITVSIGVSYNKIYAKLGSDLRKPDATSVISEDNYKDIVWTLPVSTLLYVGPRTTAKLANYGIRTIGHLANADDSLIQYKLGKVGAMLKTYALGLDDSPVCPVDVTVPIKSVGNSTTPPHDIANMDDAKCIFYLLAESVGNRMREQGFRSQCISISVRATDLAGFSCQRTIHPATNLTGEIAKTALALFTEQYAHRMPFRSVGVSCQSLVPESVPEQLDMLGDYMKREDELCLDRTMDRLKDRYGPTAVVRGIVLADRMFRRVQPDRHIRPAAAFYGR